MRIGIIGSGIAGLSAAWILGRAGFEVEIFEKRDCIGLDGHCVDYSSGNRNLAIDVPSRMLNPAQWPELLKLYKQVGIETVAVDSFQTFSHFHSKPYLSIGLNSLHSLNPLSMLKNVSRRIVTDVVRLRKQGSKDLKDGLPYHLTMTQYLASQNFSSEFIYGFLFPLLSSTVCTCSYAAIENYPAVIVLESLEKITSFESKYQLLRTTLGTRDVVKNLLKHEPGIRTNATVTSVSRCDDGVDVVYQDNSTNGGPATVRMDHVILATQASHSNEILSDATDQERQMLSCFENENVTVAVHTDVRLMPPNEKSWSTFNFVTNYEIDSAGEMAFDESSPVRPAAMCSVWLRRFYDDDSIPKNLFQTINPIVNPTPDSTISSSELQRAIVTQQCFDGWKKIEELNQESRRKVWFAGSYASPGVPLLENGVVSSQRVVQSIETQRVQLTGRGERTFMRGKKGLLF